MKKKSLLMALLLGCLCLASCGSNTALKEIRERGVLRVGVKVDVPQFGCINPETNLPEGLEIDLARLMAQEILGNSEAVKLIGVTALTREVMLDNGELDIVIATFTITEERKKRFHFSRPYYQDSIGFLTLKDAGLSTLQDMDGKTIGIAQFGTADAALTAEAKALGLDIQLRRFASYPEIMAALYVGEVDAFSVDKSILLGYDNEQTIILDASFQPQDYGIAVKRSNTALAKYIDELLASIEKDGRLAEIQSRWSH